MPISASRILLRAVVAATLAMLAACASESEDDSDSADSDIHAKTTVQMNDVSVMYPLAKTSAELAAGYLTPASTGAAGALLPKSVFDVIGSAVSGVHGGPSFDDLHVVAFRLDPCFAQIGPVTSATTCSHQLRLVFQGLNAGTNGKASATDEGFHAFYTLTPTEFDATLKEIVALRVANSHDEDLGPLAVHPIMAKQGLGGAMAKGLNAIVLAHAGQAKLTKLTGFFAVFAQHTSWNFAGAEVVNGVATLAKIPGLAGNQTAESVGLGTAPENLIALSFPKTTTHDDLQTLVVSTAQEATPAARQKAHDSALRIENPDFHSPNTIDCASCHTAEIARQLVGEQFFHFDSTANPNRFVADPKAVTARDIRQSYPVKEPKGLAANLHAFSYDGTEPMIIQRVINETAAIVRDLARQGPR